MNGRDTDSTGPRLHVVTGKGGTGKTTAAAALALALATDGRRSLLIEVEGRQGIAQLFDCPPLPYDERKVASAPGGGEVYALSVDPEEALLEYLQMFYNLGRAGKALTKFGVMDFATTIAPGVRDVLLTGKATEAVRRRDGDRRVYDAVVMDAPPTGRIARFLNVNTEVAGIARAGPIHHHAEKVMQVIRSPETAVHLVTLLEDMPVQETVDGVTSLREVSIPVGNVIVNMTRPSPLEESVLEAASSDRLDTDELALGLKAAGIDTGEAGNSVDPHPTVVQALSRELTAHAERIALERREREELSTLGLPGYELPLLADGVDLGGLYGLAERLRVAGVP